MSISLRAELMAMVDVGHIPGYRRTRIPGRLAGSEGRQLPGAASDEPDELSQ